VAPKAASSPEALAKGDFPRASLIIEDFMFTAGIGYPPNKRQEASLWV